MIQKILTNCLKPIILAESRLRNRRLLTFLFLSGALGGLLLTALAIWLNWWSWLALSGLMTVLLISAGIGLIRSARRRPNLRILAHQVETKHPELRAALLTAVSQKPDADGKLSYLQSQLLGEITEHAVKNQWVRRVSEKRLRVAGWAQLLALSLFCASTLWLVKNIPKSPDKTPLTETPKKNAPPTIGITVSPGDVEVEKGTRLVVEASFSGLPPATATLVIFDPGNGGVERGRIPMLEGLDEMQFSALIAKVDSDARYQINFGDKQSDSYSITTFEHPRLERSDATVTPPAYVEEKPHTVEDTRKVSLLEGSSLQWRIKINKPVAAAELFGEDESIIPLKPSQGDPLILLATHQPRETQKYRLHLVDAEARANRRPPWFSVTVKKNLPPKLDFVFPKRDVEVSAIQELPVEAKIWDDIGVLKAGITFQYGDTKKDIALIDTKRPGGKQLPVKTLFPLEKIGARPRDLVSYHLWAEDIGPGGKPRRTSSDLFFAEVRQFEDIFRESESIGGASGEQQGGETLKLLKLQKEILDATWKVLRRQEMGRAVEELQDDISVLVQSQNIAIEKTLVAIKKVEDAEMKTILHAAKEEMDRAAASFELVLNQPKQSSLTVPWQFVRKAYEKLIQARAREHRVSQSQNPSRKGQAQGQEAQLMNLELKQKEMKYREESEARNEQKTPEQKENLEVLNKLKELARRQEAIAEKIKELQTALEEASTQEEKRELERQLKRLQEEQEQLLRETDDLLEKMDSEQNRANMAEDRERLEKTRESIREASDKIKDQKLAGATNAATRAGRELDEATDEFRKKTSRKFSREMKDLRKSARDLTEKQKEISDQLEDGETGEKEKDPFFQGASPLENRKLSQKLEGQRQSLQAMIEKMKKLSEKSEGSEPLLSDALYESVRNAIVNGVGDSLEEARDFTRYNQRDQARVPEQAAARGIEELKEEVESAAAKILGSESDSLRLARSEVDKLIEQVKEEEKRLRQSGNGEGSDKAPPQLAMNKSKKGGKEATRQGQVDDPTGSGDQDSQPKEEGKGQEKKSDTSRSKRGEKGSAQGEGKPGSKSGEKQAAGQPAEDQKGSGRGDRPGNQQGPTSGEGKGRNRQPASQANGDSSPGKTGGNSAGAGGAANLGGTDRGREPLRGPGNGARGGQPLFFDRPEEQRVPGPITGEDFKQWADRLGNVEEMVDQEDIRNGIATILDDARAMRIDYRRDNLPPGADTIGKKITTPLVELRARLSEELAKLNKENPVAPIDRDPVPGEFRDLVRRYYENLGAGE